jgi:tetratricopeptide (TPR) repeat protein
MQPIDVCTANEPRPGRRPEGLVVGRPETRLSALTGRSMIKADFNSTFAFVARSVFALALFVGLSGGGIAADVPVAPGKPVAPGQVASQPHKDQIDQLIKQLGDKNYYVRQRAQESLAKLGFDAFDALTAATTNDDLEIASRAKYLLRLMRVEWTAENDPPEVKRCLQNYEFEEPQSRETKMRALAALPNGAGIVALCRLVRFEKLLLLSKTAAVTLLTSQMTANPPGPDMTETVRKGLADCRRPGAVWLSAWLRLGREPDVMLHEWTKLIDAELKQPPNETSPDIVGALIRFQIVRLKKLGKTDEAMAAIQRLVALEPGNAETMAELLDWLVRQKAWKAVDDLAQRFPAQFAAEPGLLYSLAQAYAEQDRKDTAEETALRAFRLNPGKQQRQLIHHLMAAQHLRQQGQFAWARREFEHVATQHDGAEHDDLTAMAQSMLAEMLHDQGQDLDAADTLGKLVAAIDSRKITEPELNGRRPNEVRARMNYFAACHWESKGDAKKHREAIDKALKADPTDVDVLIACYRVPDPSPEYRAKVLGLIKKSAAECHELIAAAQSAGERNAEESGLATSCNQLAWLVGNTEGDMDEALRCSRRSVELKPDEGGFRDTLARVYFARGDLQNAVLEQTKAAELDPHSGLIQRQLNFFRKKLEEKQK